MQCIFGGPNSFGGPTTASSRQLRFAAADAESFGRVARARTGSCAERLARFVRPRADSRDRTKSFEPLNAGE